jgi:hypothetical protein
VSQAGAADGDEFSAAGFGGDMDPGSLPAPDAGPGPGPSPWLGAGPGGEREAGGGAIRPFGGHPRAAGRPAAIVTEGAREDSFSGLWAMLDDPAERDPRPAPQSPSSPNISVRPAAAASPAMSFAAAAVAQPGAGPDVPPASLADWFGAGGRAAAVSPYPGVGSPAEAPAEGYRGEAAAAAGGGGRLSSDDLALANSILADPCVSLCAHTRPAHVYPVSTLGPGVWLCIVCGPLPCEECEGDDGLAAI